MRRRWPGSDLFRYEQAGLDASQVVGQAGEMCHRRHHAVAQSEDGLDESDCTRGGFGVAEIAFRRTDQALATVGAVHLRQAAELEWVTHRCAGAMRLHHADCGRVHAGHGEGRPIDVGLGIQRWCRECRRSTVLIRGGPADDGQDPVAVAQGIG